MRRRLTFAVSLALLATSLGAAPPVFAAAADLLPDLQMAPLLDVTIEAAPHGGKKLRFGTLVNNVGDGQIEIRGSDRSGREMLHVAQWIYRDNGTSYGLPQPKGRMFYSGDGHDHFHLEKFNIARLTPLSPTPTSTSTRHLRKIGFCLVDSVQMPAPERPPNSINNPQYWSCGDLSSVSVTMGISVGWGDTYPALFAHQSIDVTGLPKGNYRLCVTVNSRGLWREKNDNYTNNSQWLNMFVNAARNKVTILESGATPC